jgi:hypothetical protein
LTRSPSDLIPWARLAAAPFALVEVAIERGNYPDGHERWAWAIAGAFAAGAALFVFVRWRLPALAFDAAVVSAFVALYGFEPSSPVRELFFLVVAEAALLYGVRGGLLVPPAAIPALVVFEERAADRLGVPFDPGHVLAPFALQLVLGVVVGMLASKIVLDRSQQAPLGSDGERRGGP